MANREGGLSLVLAADTVCVCKEIEKRENTSYLYLSRYYQVAKIPHLMGVRVQMSNPQFTRDASVRTSYAILFVVKVH